MAGISRTGERLRVAEQVRLGRSPGVNVEQNRHFRGRPLALTITEPSGKIRSAGDIFMDGKLSLRTPLLDVDGTTVTAHTLAGHPIKIERLDGLTPAEIDGRMAAVDSVMALSASRAPIIPMPNMIHIPGGTFPVEGSYLWASGAKPKGPVTISPFDIDQTEVTVAHFRAFVEDEDTVNNGAYKITGQGVEQLTALLADHSKDNHPIVYVNQADARAYAIWRSNVIGENYHLPSAAQWEIAARGTEGRTYPWGPEFDRSKLNSNSSGTTDVFAHRNGATPQVVLDLAGNVWEWMDTNLGNYDPNVTTDPRGPATGDPEMRGGSFGSEDADYFRGASRTDDGASDRDGSVGFRLARTSK